MTTPIIIIILFLVMSGVIYLLLKHTQKLKDERDSEKSRADQYFNAMQDNKILKEKAAEIDKQIEVKKDERKKLSKLDKIKLANSRNSGD